MPDNIRMIIYDDVWYIVVTEDGKIIGDCTIFEDEQYKRYMTMIQTSYSQLEIYPSGLENKDTNSIIKIN